MRLRISRNNPASIECELEAEDFVFEEPCPAPGCKMGKVHGHKCHVCLGMGYVVTWLGVALMNFLAKHYKDYKNGELPGWKDNGKWKQRKNS